jgi:hypothetical protein
MQAIMTKYMGATNSRGSRIKAWTESGHSVTVPYPHEKHQGAEAHSVAAIALVQKLGWYGDLIAGGTDVGYVFVFAHSDRFETGVTKEQEREAFEAKIAQLNA